MLKIPSEAFILGVRLKKKSGLYFNNAYLLSRNKPVTNRSSRQFSSFTDSQNNLLTVKTVYS